MLEVRNKDTRAAPVEVLSFLSLNMQYYNKLLGKSINETPLMTKMFKLQNTKKKVNFAMLLSRIVTSYTYRRQKILKMVKSPFNENTLITIKPFKTNKINGVDVMILFSKLIVIFITS